MYNHGKTMMINCSLFNLTSLTHNDLMFQQMIDPVPEWAKTRIYFYRQ